MPFPFLQAMHPIIFSTPVAVLGTFLAIKLSFQLLSVLWISLRPSSLPRYHHGQPGSTWALVTGASDGIGLATTQELLLRGFNVLLHGRNQSKLDALLVRLQSTHPTAQLRTVTSDASSSTPDTSAILAAAAALPGKLTILVNNVGGLPPGHHFETLDAQSAAALDAALNVNARFPAQLTRALLPLLRTHQPALIINHGSVTGLIGLPFLSVYAASKAFVVRFSEGVHYEALVAGGGVEVLGVVIGNVATARNRTAVGGWFTCTAEECARLVLDKVGCGYPLVFCWWRHALQLTALSALPQFVVRPIVLYASKEAKRQSLAATAKDE